MPADIGTLLVQSFAAAEFDARCELVRIYLEEGSGGVSGGTLASFAELFEAASTDPVARQTVRNPYSLAPPPMAPVNERVIRRSNALPGYP